MLELAFQIALVPRNSVPRNTTNLLRGKAATSSDGCFLNVDSYVELA